MQALLHIRRGGWLFLSGALATIGCSFLTIKAPAQTASGYHIIVHTSNRIDQVGRKQIADMFLKKTTRWKDGQSIAPVDLPADSAVRQKFSNEILGRSVGAVRNYWQQIIFSGRGLPPAELKNDEEVIKYVQSHRGAIGYISTKANPQTVKAISIR